MPGTEGTQQTQQTTQQTQQQTQTQQTQAAGISEERVRAIIAEAQGALDKGVQQKESAILRQYFEKEGMTPEEAKAALDTFKTNKAQAAKQEQEKVSNMEKRIAELEAEKLQGLINATVTSKASELGVDPAKISYLNRLADLKGVTNDKGEVDEAKVKTAIEAVLKDFPELKAGSNNNGTNGNGFVQVGGKGGSTEGANDALNKMRQAMGLKPIK